MTNIAKTDYFSFNSLENVYLEDSYVLGISVEASSVEFDIDVVLTENHVLYTSPSEDEQYCYKRAKLIFPNVTEIHWIKKTMIPYKGADGNIDFGNIDELYFEDEKYHVIGDWGELEIASMPPKLEIESTV